MKNQAAAPKSRFPKEDIQTHEKMQLVFRKNAHQTHNEGVPAPHEGPQAKIPMPGREAAVESGCENRRACG